MLRVCGSNQLGSSRPPLLMRKSDACTGGARSGALDFDDAVRVGDLRGDRVDDLDRLGHVLEAAEVRGVRIRQLEDEARAASEAVERGELQPTGDVRLVSQPVVRRVERRADTE